MIRFIDLRGMSTGHAFAFFDTVTDRFVQIGGEQAWQDRADLEAIFDDRVPQGVRTRLLGHLPKWADSYDQDKDDAND